MTERRGRGKRPRASRSTPLQHQDLVRAIALSADGKTALTGSHDSMARLVTYSINNFGALLTPDGAEVVNLD